VLAPVLRKRRRSIPDSCAMPRADLIGHRTPPGF
jgi:hypothetical protein